MPPATAASKAKATPFFAAQRGKLVAVMRQHRLVGGDDVLAGGERGLDQIERHALGAADQLDHHVDPGIGGEIAKTPVPFRLRQIDAAIALAVASPAPRKARSGARRGRR